MKARGWATTDVGRKREHNEDSYLCNLELGLYGVADGMGGHLGGERASRLAAEVLEREIAARRVELLAWTDDKGGARGPEPRAVAAARTGTAKTEPPGAAGTAGAGARPAPHPIAGALREATRRAGALIHEAAQTESEYAGMGTTLTAVMFHGSQASVSHVGDSRLYLYRDGSARQLTDDHSWIQEQIRAGLLGPDDALVARFRNVITRSVGFEPEVEPDLLTLPVELGDCFVLCTDGLSNYVSEEELGRVLTAHFYRDAGRALVDIANERGGDDNITCVIVYIGNY